MVYVRLCLACVLALAGVVRGEELLDFGGLTPVSLSITSNVRSKYVFSNAAVLSEDPVIQTDVFVLTRSGLFLDVWHSLPANMQGIGEGYATELYVTAGWTGKVGDCNLTFGIGYEDLHENLTADDGDFIILSAEASRDFEIAPSFTLSPFVRVEVNFTLGGSDVAETLPRLGARYAWKINDTLSLTGKAMVVYDPGVLGGDEAIVGNVESSLMWRLGNNVTLELPFVRYVDPLNSVSDGRGEHVVLGAGITIRF